MKLTTTLMIAAAIAVTSGTAAAQKISVDGSPHNFKDNLLAAGGATLTLEADWNTTGEICAPCHTPHTDGSVAEMGLGLLWSHKTSTTSWGSYVSFPPQSINQINGVQTAEPEGSDKMCLSCHDGTIGLDEFAHNGTPAAGAPFLLGGNANTTFGYGVAKFGNANETHPISVTYVAGNGMRATSATFGTGTIADVLEGGSILRCSSCHDVHGDEAVTNTPLLRLANTASQLCLTCHDK